MQKFAIEPEESDLTTKIDFRLPSGARVSRRFNKNETVGLLYEFIAVTEAHKFDN